MTLTQPGASDVSTRIDRSSRFSVLPDDQTLSATAAALEARGFSVDLVDHLNAARETVLARIPHGATVITNPSVTLAETGIAAAINDGGPYESARRKILALDRATQLRKIKGLFVLPDFALGSVHAVTRDGILVIASAPGNQLAAYASGATNVIFVVGAQKLVPDLKTARERIHQHSLELENVRAIEAYGQRSRIGKILQIHEEKPGRVHVVRIREAVGF